MTDRTDPLPQNVLEAIQRRNLIEAIKLLREQTGLGLKEAKELVDHHTQANTPATSGAVPETLPRSAAEALKQGSKIEAIRLLRQETGIGLKEARSLVEANAEQTQGVLSPGEVPRSRVGAYWLVAFAILIAVIVYFVLQRNT